MTAVDPAALASQCLALLRAYPDAEQARTLATRLMRAPATAAADRLALAAALAETAPDDPDALNDHGCMLLQVGEMDGGIAILREVRRRFPGHALAAANLGVALLRQDERDEAHATFAAIADAAVLDCVVAPALAEHVLEFERRADGRHFAVMARLYDHWAERNPLSADAVSRTVQAHLCAGDLDGAGAALSRAEAIIAAAPVAAETRSMIAEVIARHRDKIAWVAACRDGRSGCPAFTGPAGGDRHVIPIAVWGDDFIDMLEELSLPSLMQPGNLPALAGRGEVQVLVMTLPQHVERLRASAAVAAVAAIARCAVVAVPSLFLAGQRVDVHPYRMMSLMAYTAYAHARRHGAHLFHWAPDMVAVDGLLTMLDDRRRAGADMVFLPGILCHAGRARAALEPGALSATVAAPELVRRGLASLEGAVEPMLYRPDRDIPESLPMAWPTDSGGYVFVRLLSPPYLTSHRALERGSDGLFFSHDADLVYRLLTTPDEARACVLVQDLNDGAFLEVSRFKETEVTRMSRDDYVRRVAALGPRAPHVLRPVWCDAAPFDAADSGWRAAQAFAAGILADAMARPQSEAPDWLGLWGDHTPEPAAPSQQPRTES